VFCGACHKVVINSTSIANVRAMLRRKCNAVVVASSNEDAFDTFALP